jgi:DNA-binding GntR family transcriptional regulator
VDAFCTLGSLTSALQSLGIPSFRRIETSIAARLPTTEEALLLQLSAQFPIFEAVGVDVDPSDQPIMYGIGLFPANRVRFVWRADG